MIIGRKTCFTNPAGRGRLRGSSVFTAICLAALFLSAVLSARSAVFPAAAVEPGSTVVVVYNSSLPASRQVAEYYAQRRQVPTNQVFGFDLPVTEEMTRDAFVKKLQLPLWQRLQSAGLLQVATVTNASPATVRRVVGAAVRYMALCYGVPTKVVRDANLVEPGMEQIRTEFRRNEASVDSDLACLPLTEQHMLWTGPNSNPFYGVTNAALMNPRSGIMLVTRLDGPTPEIAKGLVDKAMEAETNGLWGRAYIDARGIREGGYLLGDEWMRTAARLLAGLGFETDVDEKPQTFSAGYPMSHIAFYAGWYDENVSGPFTRSQVEFMPGAFAYHLHSFSARTLRTTNQNWVGPLLAKGATITLGSVDEPYLSGTPDIAMFIGRFLYSGFSFGEAAYAAQNAVSWQNIAVGDPLYRPFGRHPGLIQADLEKQGNNKLLELCHQRLVNLRLASGTDPEDMISYLDHLPLTQTSAVLTEKQANLYWKAKRLSDGLSSYDKALKLNPTPQQKVRLLLTFAEKQTFYGPDQAGYDAYQRVLREVPDYPDKLPIYQSLLSLAQKLEKKEEITKLQQVVEKLSPKPPASAPTPAPKS